MAGYKGKFGREPVGDFFKQDDWYEQMFVKYGDPRTTDLPLMRTPEIMLSVIAAYLLFVYFGPRVMKSREPFSLRALIVAYNFAMVAVSAYMCSEYFLTSRALGYDYACDGVDWKYSRDPVTMRMVHINWLFFISKIIELADTVFFILRKKDNQVTFLHVYHHATMILNWWMACKYLPVGQSFFVGMINSGIHALMYIYYGLAACGPSMQKYLWWKKHMTTLQLIQFIAVITHTSYNKFVRTDCDYPFLYNSIVFYYTWSMVLLFSHFFYQTYIQAKQRRSNATAAKVTTAKHASNGTSLTGGENGTAFGDKSDLSAPENNNLSNGVRSRKK